MRLILLLVVLGAGFLFLPQLMEKSDSGCSALERRIVAAASSQGTSDQRLQTTIVGSVLAQVSAGTLASAAVQQRYPNLPPQVGCAAVYWQLLADQNKAS